MNKFLKSIASIAALFVFVATAALSAVEYEIEDIGTLQTQASEPIAINNPGQILGWYNIDGTPSGKYYFVRDEDGTFREIPKYRGWDIDWKFLRNDGRAYGKFNGQGEFGVLCCWDKQKGVTVLGELPGREISAINDAGQVLIKSVDWVDDSGEAVKSPVVWHNNEITWLNRPFGNLGLESKESHGLDMNNHGDVVGYAVVDMVYKGKVYKQNHAFIWSNENVIDLHKMVPKTEQTEAKAINDIGMISIAGYWVFCDGKMLVSPSSKSIASDGGFVIFGSTSSLAANVFSFENGNLQMFSQHPIGNLQVKISNDYESIWMNVFNIIDINDNGKIIAVSRTVWGEIHAVLLTPKN